MQSKPLKDAIDLALDTMGMAGPITFRGVAERVLQETNDDYWSLADEREAKLAAVQSEAKRRANLPMPSDSLSKILPRVPVEYRASVEKLPRFICISPRGGHGAEHVMSWNATPDDWNANFSLKEYVAERAALSRDEARAMRDLLNMNGAASLSDLFARVAAE